MAISELTGQRSTAQSSSSTVTVTYASTPTENNLLVAAFSCKTRTVSSAPSGWSQAVVSPFLASTENLYIYYKIAGASEPTNPSWTMSGSSNWVIAASEWSGIETSSPLDVTKTNNGTGTAGTTGTHSTLAQADELIVVAYCNVNIRTWGSHDNSQTELGEITSTAGPNATKNNISLAARIVSSTTGVNYGATLSSSFAHGVALASFKASSAPAVNTGAFFAFF